MAEFDLELEGLSETIEDLERLEERWTGQQQWLVGTSVEYAIYLEFGTSEMDPKPFFRPAVDRVQSKIEDIADGADSIDDLLSRVAIALEREVKQVITKKGLIDTGTLRASITAIPGGDPAQLPSAAEVDPIASETVEVSA